MKFRKFALIFLRTRTVSFYKKLRILRPQAQAQASGPLCVENVTHACLPRLLVCLSLGLNCHSLSVRFAEDEPCWFETFELQIKHVYV